MSYILDALRKADAQRERDPARGIHAHPVPLPDDSGRARASRLPVYMGGALGAIAIAAWLLWPKHAVDQAPAQAAQSNSPAAPAPAPAVIAARSIEPPPPPVAAAAPVQRVEPVVAAASSAPAPAASTAAPAAGRIVTIAELPADVQQGLPKLPISGGVYSPDRAQRMLVVGGQVATEGTEVAPGLVLEEIRSRQAVLRFRGWRYLVDY